MPFTPRRYSEVAAFNCTSSKSPTQSQLDHKRNEIRLLTILPGGEDDPMSCIISKTSLDDSPSYEALSYMWGDPNPRERICLGGRMIDIGNNLAKALRHLRYRTMPRTVWVDAICIDQFSDEERNHQVKLMKSIYFAASQVLIWLGEAKRGSTFTLDCIESLGQGQPVDIHTATLAHIYFQSHFGRQWATRVWVVQELAVAKKDPRIGCGHKWLLWSTFVAGCSALARENGSTRLFISDNQAHTRKSADYSQLGVSLGDGIRDKHFREFDDLNRLRNDFTANKGLSLQKLLYLTMDLEATDPRDKVYALLGLLEERERGCINPDYRKTALLVYTEAMAYLLRYARNVQPACFFNLTKPDSTALPSWVPDFSQQRKSSYHNPLGFYHDKHNASGPILSDGKDYVLVSEDMKTITADGVFVDRVDNVVPTSGIDMATANYDEFALSLREIERVAKYKVGSISRQTHFSRRKDIEPLWQVLVANKSASGIYGCPPAYERMHEVLCGREKAPREFTVSINRAVDPSYIYTGEYRTALATSLLGRSFFTTSTGFLGIGLPGIEIGDIVTILLGARLPFMLRRKGEDFQMMGACYVSGIMNGEILNKKDINWRLRSKKFVIK